MAVNLSLDTSAWIRRVRIPASKITWSADMQTTGCYGYAPRKDIGTIVCEILPKTHAE